VITSKTNSKVRYARSLHRRSVRYRERRFVVEGVRLIEEMIEAGHEPALFFCTEDSSSNPRARALVEALTSSSAEVVGVSEDVMRFMADTKTPQGVLAVVPFPDLVTEGSHLILVLDGLRDPGNLGTILRSAEAAGVGQVITMRGSVDVFGPKVVRGGMGAHFHLPIRADCSWMDVRGVLRGRQVVVADPRGEKSYDEVDWSRPSALIVGGEARGATAEARQTCEGTVSIPMRAGIESLNVAVATSIILFEAARQLRVVVRKAEGRESTPSADSTK
jgi:TrmH family RNA methyltransferase